MFILVAASVAGTARGTVAGAVMKDGRTDGVAMPTVQFHDFQEPTAVPGMAWAIVTVLWRTSRPMAVGVPVGCPPLAWLAVEDRPRPPSGVVMPSSEIGVAGGAVVTE